ncbi:DUF4012 domain-containing protein [Cellulomonas xiejunii]|uniref:DUF4012 domain-containing protein n=1 Tax=Cellulomonas xiejunii TaxID=2968083 RepID=A0ABY5KQD2_9CELL|nr:DUF4012 domain-containing protein [Cellulomonas xiejunii]MCC2315637.1 DUF4012 domain-containing protein [Cellulomonas xiejunii]MCC2322587.1 DUF4012 domain-containing protein [Cellulomonas xiejunii]UUI72620.1 DUF4012 domain-containing protein [Cellulomonas xiejunii]
MDTTGAPVEHDGPAQVVGRQAEPTAGPRGRRVLARVVVVVLVLVLLAVGWVAVRAWQAASALQDARAWLGDVELDATSVDTVTDSLPELQESTRRAAAASADPVWRAAEVLPWAGDQLEAVRVVSTSLDAVVVDSLPAVSDLRALAGGGLRLPDGRFDVAALRAVAARVETAAATVADAHADVAALDPDALVGPLADPVRQVQHALARIDAGVGPAGRVAGVLPGMLGGDGPRTYLVLALNTAELRPAGGIVGNVVAVRVDDGAVTLVDSLSTVDLPGLPDTVAPLTAEELDTWGPRLGRWIQNAVLTPDFPRTAELVAARWAHSVGGTVDGVVATDPVAVAGLVGATGSVADPDGGTLDAAGLVDALLRDSYVRHPDPAAADAYFGAVAANLVAAVGTGTGDPQALLLAARSAVDERRVRVWSAHPQEQERLAATVAGGAFTSEDLFVDQPGVFLADATQGKLGAYLSTDVTFRDARCSGPSPTVDAVLHLDFRPPDGVETWGPYVTGAPGPEVALGTLLTNVSVWSAQGAAPLVVTRDGRPATGRVTTVAGRTVQEVASRLAPGQTQELVVTVPLQDGAAQLWTTPTLTSPGAASYRCE